MAMTTTTTRKTDRRHVDHRAPSRPAPAPTNQRARTIYTPAKAKSKSSTFAVVLAQVAGLAVLALAVFWVSNLLGNVKVEQARKAAADAYKRTAEVRRDEAQIRARVTALTRGDRVEEWAATAGMLGVDGLGQAQAVTTGGQATH